MTMSPLVPGRVSRGRNYLRPSHRVEWSLRLECGDADLVSSIAVLPALRESDVGKASNSKSGFQRCGIERHERVVDVRLPNPVSIKGVNGHESAPGPQHSMKFGKQLILCCLRGHVVQHREAGGGRESTVWQRQLGPITPNDLDVGAGEADFQVGRQVGVDLNCGNGRCAVAEKVSGQTWSRADLQDIIAQIDGGFKPGEQVGLQSVGPLGAGEIFEMGFVHVSISTIDSRDYDPTLGRRRRRVTSMEHCRSR
jgi:hypothetical protein